jgi:hypothetical protein
LVPFYLKRQCDRTLGEPPAPGRPHRLTLLGTAPHRPPAGHPLRRARLLPADAPTSLELDVRGPAQLRLEPPSALLGRASQPRFSAALEPGVRDLPLVQPHLGRGEVSGLTVAPAAAARLEAVDALVLEGALPLAAELPFAWRPPLVFPPQEGGRRARGWFIVEARPQQLRVEEDGRFRRGPSVILPSPFSFVWRIPIGK